MFGKLFGSASTSSDVDVQEAKRRLDAGALLVDVREGDEWQGGHASGARHIPLGQLAGRLAELPKEREILVICRSGNRSSGAVRQLKAAGYAQVLNVAGGTMAWMREGLPISR